MRATRSWLRFAGASVAAVCLALAPSAPAEAQEARRGVLIAPVVSGEGEALAASMQRVVRQRLVALEVARLEATPALGLDDLGLAVGCVGRTPACLEQIAQQLDVEMLVWLELERSGGVVSLALTAFERGESAPRQVTRGFRGAAADGEALDEAEALVRELFDLPPPAVAEVGDVEAADRQPEAQASAPRAAEGEGDDALEIGAASGLLGVGALALGAGIVLGAVAQASGDEYRSIEIRTSGDVDEAIAVHERASAEATAANVLFVAGGVLLAAGATVLVLSLALADDGDETPAVAVAPMVGPDGAGLVAFARFGGER